MLTGLQKSGEVLPSLSFEVPNVLKYEEKATNRVSQIVIYFK